MLIINFKNYLISREAALTVAHACLKVSKEAGIPINMAVPAMDIANISQLVSTSGETKVWMQHIDGVSISESTGWNSAQMAKERGVSGVLLNHSEHKLLNDEIRKSIEASKKQWLTVCVCAENLEEMGRLVEFSPDFIAYEPAELIGSKDKSVSSEKGQVVSQAITLLAGRIPLFIGAGVHNATDIKVGLALGAKGFLIASAVVTASNPEQALRELVIGFKS
jgi:triosephosphate isomerase (TIM)